MLITEGLYYIRLFMQLNTTTGEDTEGLSFVPQAFGSVAAGTLVVASEGSGNIRAIKPDGTMTTIAIVPSAEMVSFVPLNLGISGNPLEDIKILHDQANISLVMKDGVIHVNRP